MFLGLSLTSYWYSWASPNPTAPFGGYTFKIGYLYFAFFVIEACKTLIEHKHLSALPYFYMGDGVLGIVSVLIIKAGYPPSFADFLLGPIFLITVAVSIFFSEWAIVRPTTIFFVAMGRTLLDKKLERRFRVATNTGAQRLQLFSKHFAQEVALSRKLTYNERIDLINLAVSYIFKKRRDSVERMHTVRFDWRIATGAFTFNLLWPVGVGLVAWLIF
jgi:hypothetical protein